MHVLQPLVTGGVADETLLGLPESVRRVIYELLPAPAVGLVAEAAKPLREEASSDVVWASLLRRDADALLGRLRDAHQARSAELGRAAEQLELYAPLLRLRIGECFEAAFPDGAASLYVPTCERLEPQTIAESARLVCCSPLRAPCRHRWSSAGRCRARSR